MKRHKLIQRRSGPRRARGQRAAMLQQKKKAQAQKQKQVIRLNSISIWKKLISLTKIQNWLSQTKIQSEYQTRGNLPRVFFSENYFQKGWFNVSTENTTKIYG